MLILDPYFWHSLGMIKARDRGLEAGHSTVPQPLSQPLGLTEKQRDIIKSYEYGFAGNEPFTTRGKH